jgi:hypothetical protein
MKKSIMSLFITVNVIVLNQLSANDNIVNTNSYIQLPDSISKNASIKFENIPKCPNSKIIDKKNSLLEQLVEENNKFYKKKEGYKLQLSICQDSISIKTNIKLVQYKFTDKLLKK